MVVVFYVPTYTCSTTDLLYMCSKQKHKADHGHKKGHAPRAQEGHPSTDISRPRTEVLRTRAYFSAANIMLRSRALRGHLNLFIYMYVHAGSFVIPPIVEKCVTTEYMEGTTACR